MWRSQAKHSKPRAQVIASKSHLAAQTVRKAVNKKPKFKLSGNDQLMALSLKYFGGMADRLYKKLPTLEGDLLRSSYFMAPHGFLSLVIMISIFMVPVSIVGAVMLVVTHNILFAITLPMPAMAFMMGISMPKSSKGGRAGSIDGELPFVIGYLSVLITGGVAPIELFRRLASSKLYPNTAKEAKRVILNVDVLAMDPLSGIERAGKYCPNKMFADFLAGYVAVTKVGGDIQSFMELKQKEIFSHRGIKLKSATEFTGTLAESYIAATVVMGTSLFILQVVQAVLSKGAYNYSTIYLFSGVLVPVISAAFIYILHSTQTKEPISNMRVHYLFGAGLVMIPLMMFVVPLDIPQYAKLGIGLALSTAPAAAMNYFISKAKSAAEAMLPSFVLDLAEIRKTGLAPEKGIEALAGRNYGSLSGYIQRMASQVSWGVPLTKVLQDFGKGLHSWFVTSVGFILLEVIEVGGATTGLFNSLAEFTQRTRDLEKERRSLFRPYIFMPYIGAILTIISTVLIINMVSTQLTKIGGTTGTGVVHVNADTSQLSSIMMSATLFQSWTMGIVAGKMGEWSVASGYKHASALAAIGLVTVYVFTNFIKI